MVIVSSFVIFRQLTHIYNKDKQKYGDPANSGLSTTPVMAHQQIVDKWAGRVKVPVDDVAVNGNGKRRRVDDDESTTGTGEVGGH
jgi:hypothetical protein